MYHVLPWQQQEWQYLVNRRNTKRLPHAILIKGVNGVGKSLFAQKLAELFLCKKDLIEVATCGECTSCQLLQANSHPDLIIIRPEEDGKAIKIDQIRDMVITLNNTSHQDGYKVVIIESAELLNVAAANALLKTLEEPASHIIILLVSSCPMALPATIRSRCQVLSIQTPKYSVAKGWLEQQLPNADIKLLLALTENAPLKALSLFEEDGLQRRKEFFDSLYALQLEKINPVQMAARCLNWGLESLAVILMYVINDMIKIKFAVSENIVNQDQIEKLAGFAQKTNLNRLFVYKDLLVKLRRYIVQKINLNQQLIIENLIISWAQLFHK